MERSLGQLLLVCGPAYVVFAIGMWASWDLGSAPAVVGVAVLATALAALMYGGFSIITAQGVGITFKARRNRKNKKAKKSKAAMPSVQIVEAQGSSSAPAA